VRKTSELADAFNGARCRCTGTRGLHSAQEHVGLSLDDVKWITPGNSAISGTVLGKQEVGALWAKLAEKGFTTSPQFWFSDEDRVVVLTQISVGGEQADQADVLTYRDGKLVKFQTAGDTALFERVFGSK
jgi:uncharacterized protein